MRSEVGLKGHMPQHCREPSEGFLCSPGISQAAELVGILVYTGDCYRGSGGPQRGRK